MRVSIVGEEGNVLGNILLIVLQFVLGFIGAPVLLGFIPVSEDLRLFVHAALYALIVYVVGVVASLVLKGVIRRSPAALVASLVLALAGAAVMLYGQPLLHAIPLKFPPLYLPLILAIAGYFFRR